MSKEYRYRKHIRWGQYAIFIFFFLLFLSLLGSSVFLALQDSFARFMAIFLGIFAFVLLIEGAVLWYLYYQLAGTSVSLNDDVLVHKTRKGEKRYPLEDVYLEFASIKYTGGWLKLKAGKDTIRLTVVLEDISGFLQELKTKLDSKQLSGHYDERKLFEFLKTAAASDQSWERMSPLLKKMILLFFDLGVAIFTGFAFGSLPGLGLIFAFAWAWLSMFWISIAYTIAEIMLMRQIAKKSDESAFTFPPRDLVYEKLVFDKTFTWGSIAYIVFSLCILALTLGVKFILQIWSPFS